MTEEPQQPPSPTLRDWVAALTREGFDPQGGTIAFTPGDPNAELTQLGDVTAVAFTVTAEDLIHVPTAALEAAKARGPQAVLHLLANAPTREGDQTTIVNWVALDEDSNLIGTGGAEDPSC